MPSRLVSVETHTNRRLQANNHTRWIAEWPLRIVLAAQKLLVATPELLAYLDWPLEVVKKSTRER